jgi:spore germination protein GerM
VTRRNLILALIVIPLLVVSGFYLRALVRHMFFENRPRPEDEMRTQLSQQALQSEAGAKQQTVTLYFPNFEAGTLVAEARQLTLAATNTDRIRQIVLALIEGSKQGHARGLPASAALRAVFLTSDGTAYLDFPNEVTQNFPVGIESETLAIYSVVESIVANIPSVKRVKFLIQGREVDTLDGHADLTGFYVSSQATTASAPP